MRLRLIPSAAQAGQRWRKAGGGFEPGTESATESECNGVMLTSPGSFTVAKAQQFKGMRNEKEMKAKGKASEDKAGGVPCSAQDDPQL